MNKEQKIRLLEERIKELEASLSAEEKIYSGLMNKEERGTGGGAHSVFERNIILQNMVNQRTGDLEDANRKLREEIAERAKTEEALRDSENFLIKLLNSIPIPVFYKDTEGRYKGLNKAFEKIFGLTREEILGKTVHDIYPEPTAEMNVAKDKELFEKGGEQQYEAQVTLIKGETRDINFHKAVVTDIKGNVTGLIGTAFDITEHKRAHDELEKSRKNYKDMFDNAMEGIFQSTHGGRHKMVNPAHARMFGYKSPEDMVSSVTDISTQIYADVEDFKKVRSLLAEKASIEDYEIQMKRKDGSIFWVSANIHTVYDDNGNFLYFEGTNVDITPHKLAEIERDKLIAELRKALAHVKKLSGMLPICASCKKIRDDKGYWNQIETYIAEHSEADFSHGLCPDCLKKLYPEYYDEIYKTGKDDDAKE